MEPLRWETLWDEGPHLEGYCKHPGCSVNTRLDGSLRRRATRLGRSSAGCRLLSGSGSWGWVWGWQLGVGGQELRAGAGAGALGMRHAVPTPVPPQRPPAPPRRGQAGGGVREKLGGEGQQGHSLAHRPAATRGSTLLPCRTLVTFGHSVPAGWGSAAWGGLRWTLPTRPPHRSDVFSLGWWLGGPTGHTRTPAGHTADCDKTSGCSPAMLHSELQPRLAKAWSGGGAGRALLGSKALHGQRGNVRGGGPGERLAQNCALKRVQGVGKEGLVARGRAALTHFSGGDSDGTARASSSAGRGPAPPPTFQTWPGNSSLLPQPPPPPATAKDNKRSMAHLLR